MRLVLQPMKPSNLIFALLLSWAFALGCLYAAYVKLDSMIRLTMEHQRQQYERIMTDAINLAVKQTKAERWK